MSRRSTPPPSASHLEDRRRSPNFTRFILTGAVLGFALGSFFGAFDVVGGGNASFRVADGSYSGSSAIGYLGLLGAMLGGILAALVAVLLDRRSR